MEANEDIEDAVLIERCQKGDERSFNILYQRYRLRLFAYIHKLIPTTPDAVDDVFQRVWIKAIANWTRYDDQQKLLAWLCRIAHNIIIDDFRRNKIKNTVELDEKIPDTSLSSPFILEDSQRTQAMEDAILQLPDDQRAVLTMRRDGKSFKEIAQVQNTSVNTVLGRMRYAILKLKDKLADFY